MSMRTKCFPGTVIAPALALALALAAGVGCGSGGAAGGASGGASGGAVQAPRPVPGVVMAEIPAIPVGADSVTTTVIVVRHAEKAAGEGEGDDPHLSAAGEARARALARALENAGVTAVITTQWIRTAETARPTARAAGVTAEVVPVKWDSISRNARDIAAAARRHRGGVVLVVGHSNTVPDIVAALGADRPGAICDSEYDRMEIVTMEVDGGARLIESRYGAPTPDGPACASMR